MNDKSDSRPIAIMDSGIGGIPYMQWLMQHISEEQLVYLADHAHFPYGEKSREELIDIVLSQAKKLLKRVNPKMFVLACNSASVSVLEPLRAALQLPVVGVVPAIKPAAMTTVTGKIGILATERTVNDGYLKDLVLQFASDRQVFTEAAPDLVSFTEENYFQSDIKKVESVIKPYIDIMMERGVDRLVLGCTHFTYFDKTVERMTRGKIIPVDSRDGVGRQVSRLLDQYSIHGTGIPKKHLFFTSKERPDQFYQKNCRETKAPIRRDTLVEGIIYSGINNIFRVKQLSDNREFLCRIKGKKLKDSKQEYNPLAVGDMVHFTEDPHDSKRGLIEERQERRNWFQRLNQKRRTPQVIAANIDMLLCFTSPKTPPFRPRFLDRVLIAAESGHVPTVIVVNKSDQGIPAEMEERLQRYRDMNYTVIVCSAETGEGLDLLEKEIKGKRIAVFGQSGVGKSTLLNRIEPGIELKTGDMSEKYNRGRHTTNFSLLIDRINGGSIIDTPGVRQIFLWGIEPEDLASYFKDFNPGLVDVLIEAADTDRRLNAVFWTP